MSRHALLIVAGIAALLLLLLLTSRVNDSAIPGVGGALVPELGADLAGIGSVRISAAGNRVIATLELRDDTWVVAERDDWPADTGKLRRLLLALLDAERVEQKTANPALYHRLGVEPIEQDDAQGVAVTIEHPAGALTVIIGETGVGGGGFSHVRRTDEAAAWLVRGDLSIGTTTGEWLRRDLLDVPASRISQLTILHPDGEEVQVAQSAPDSGVFELTNRPEGRELLHDTVAAPLGGALAALSLHDIGNAAKVLATGEPVHSIYHTWDGLVISLAGLEHDGSHWITIEAGVDEAAVERRLLREVPAEYGTDDEPSAQTGPPEPRTDTRQVAAEARAQALDELAQQAGELNARFNGRAFAIAAHKFRQITRRMEDLLAPVDDD